MFKKGDPRHPLAGRRPGSPNKSSLLVRDLLEKGGINLVELILTRIPKLKAENQVQTLLELMPYVYPKLTAVQVNVDITEQERKLKDITDADLNAILLSATHKPSAK